MTPIPCPLCGELLAAPVRFCPFCGARQVAPTVVTPAARPAPEPMAPPMAPPVVPRPPPPPPPVQPVDPLPDQTEPVAPDRHRLRTGPAAVPPAVAAPGAAPIAPAVAATEPIWADRRRARAGAVPRRVRANPNRRAATRRLFAAAFVLLCAVVLWRQLVAVPHGTLRVHLSRSVSGSILVDGIARGAPEQPISLAAGQHRIGLDAPGFDTPQRVVSLHGNDTASLTLYPTARPATLLLDSSPGGALISLDGRGIGRAPLQRSLAPGQHRIVAVAPGYRTLLREIELAPGASTPLSLPLSPLPLRRLVLDAPAAGRWSVPVHPGDGAGFTLLFRDPIRVRIGGRVVLLEPGAPVALGGADASGISISAVGNTPVPVHLLIAPAGANAATSDGPD